MHYLALLAKQTTPIEEEIEVRFSDLDPYGHLTSSKYVDLVDSAIWKWSTQHNHTPNDPQKVDPSITDISIEFKKPVLTTGPVSILLPIVERTDTTAKVSFEILSSDESVTHAKGSLSLGKQKTQVEIPKIPTGKKPILYQHPIEVRYDDLNIHNEVGPGQFIEYVITSRWLATKNLFGMDANDFVKKGMAAYNTRIDISYLTPLVGNQTINVKSWIDSISTDRSRLTAKFLVESQDGKTHFSTGSMYFVIIDLSKETPKPASLPEWGNQYFWEKS